MSKWETKKFEDCLEKVVYTNKIQRKYFLESGKYPIISQEQNYINGYWNEKRDLFKIKKPIIVFGDHTQVIKYIDFDFVLGADGVKILQTKFIEPRFFYYYLQSINIENLGYARHYRLLKGINVNYPNDISEQKRIVEILDETFAKIDKGKDVAEQNLKNAKELFESHLQSLFDENKSWELKNFEDCINNVIYTNKIQKQDFLKDGKFPIISQEQDYINGYWNNPRDLFRVKRPLIIFGDHTQVLKYIDFDFVLGADGVKILQPKKEIDPKYFYYYLKGIKLRSLGYARHYKLLKEKKVIYPKLIQEQKTIVQKLDKLNFSIKKMNIIYGNKISKMEELKKSFLHKAFAGEL